MKKMYSKPDIVYECFSLSTSIAAGCEKKIDTKSQGECGLRFGRYTVFTSNVYGCTTKIADTGEFYDGLCYHVPFEMNSLFNS